MGRLKPALHDSKGRSAPWGGSRLVNAFAEQSEGDKAELFAIMATPGLTEFANLSATYPVRGMVRMAGTLYAVVGESLYSVDSAGTGSGLGTIGGSGPVRMAASGTQIGIVADTTGYVFSGGTVHTGITNLPAVSDVAEIDGYFVWTIADSDQFAISALDNGLLYDPLDVGSVEGSPDALVGVVNDHRELLFFGTDSTEMQVNTGAADFPFERQGNAFIEHGCIDRDSIAKFDSSVVFVSHKRVVARIQGFQVGRISTHAVEKDLAAATWFRAYTYSQEGHEFYVLNTDIACWAFDAATGAWAKRRSFGIENHRISCAATAYGQTLLGDGTTGLIHVPDLEVHDEAGDPVPVIIELPPIGDGTKKQTLYAFELYCETGVGDLSTTAPQAILQYSRDGGRSWSNEMWRGMGAQGEYATRAVWRPNVEFRQLQLRITLPDKVRRLVMGYEADYR